MDTKTYTPSAKKTQHQWYVVDASDEILGRLATKVAQVLRGKHRPDFTPHLDLGDHVIVINAGKIKVTGRKEEQKVYYRHTGYPGGIRTTPYSKLLAQHPEQIVEKAIRGMLPHNTLGRHLFKKLRVYAGSEHEHAAQKPVPLPI
jgi:large subunit ribosomal protein L13